GEDNAGPGFAPGGQPGARPARAYDGPANPNDPATWGKVQRNAPCLCGSGRKFKHCHGALV
ncbi:MAG: SEC-C metal-binding domain-containing protein, partial [Rhizomicrobium sp.]